jgi:predicted lipoprotein with Yx(FWY)xxD motif/plastocyanin
VIFSRSTSASTSPPSFACLRLAVSALFAFFLIGGVSKAQNQPPTVMLPATAAGTMMTDPDGWTLYTWDGDQVGMSNCWDSCAQAWSPFLSTAEELTAPAGLAGTLGWIDRGDGTWQVSLDGWPLYYFSGDTAPGAVNGDGSMGFGARWYVTSFAAPAVAAPLPAPAPQPQVALPPVSSPPVAVAQPQPPVQAGPPMNIRIADSNFGPPVNLQVGDTVTWANMGASAHTVTSDNGFWDSGRLAPGQTYSFTFNAPGNYSYHDAMGSGMRGSIMVGNDPSNDAYGNGPFFNSPTDPGYGYGQFPQGYDGYGNPNPYIGQPPFSGLNYPTGGYSPTMNVVAPPNGIMAISWIGAPNVISYRIYETLTSAPLNFSVAQTVNQATGMLATTATLAGLTPGASYLIQVRAVGPNGLETVAPSASVGLPVNGAMLSAPTSLSVSSINASTTTLAWVGSQGATTYRVLQATSGAGPFSPSTVGAMTGTGTVVQGLNPTTTYFFQVVALDGQGNQSPPSNTATWTTTSLVLNAPAGLNVSAVTSTTATSNWLVVPSASSYRLSQSQNLNGPFTTSATMNLTPNGATVTGLAPNTTYYFQVSALDSAGNASLASNTAMGQTNP